MTLTTQGSFDSKISLAQIFTKTGQYKGQLVALKKFTKKNIEITRNMKKEMKLVRPHDVMKDDLMGSRYRWEDWAYLHIISLHIFKLSPGSQDNHPHQ